MKKIYLTFIIIILCYFSYAQTNIFPPSGNVGIGTTSPGQSLDVGGGIQIAGVGSSSPPAGLTYGLFPYSGIGLGLFSSALSPTQGIGIWTNPSGIPTEVMRISSVGNVGIGTINPAEKLAVNGKIRAKEIKVETSWSDFVFEPGYKLLSLKETEKFIEVNKHLPEIPSAKEVEGNGINLGEMNAKLLQKIEELTLHLIEQEKRSLKQEDIIIKLQDKLNFLSEQINKMQN